MSRDLTKIFVPLFILLAAFIFNYVTSIMLANIMSIEKYGLVNYAITVINITAAFILIGTNSSAKRFLNAYLYEHHTNKTTSYINWNLSIVFIPVKFSLILGLFLLLVVDPLELFFIGKITDGTQIMIFLLVASPLLASANLVASFLLCDDHIEVSTFLKQMGFYSLMLIGVYIYFTFVFNTPVNKATLEHVLILMFICYLVLMVISIFMLKKKSPKIYQTIVDFEKKGFCKKESSAWQQSARRQLLLNLMLQLVKRIDFLLLVLFSPTTTQLAAYGIAIKTAAFLELVPKGLFQHLKNKVSIQLKSETKKQQLQLLWNQSLRYNVIITIIAAMMVHNCQHFIVNVFSDSYLPAIALIKILNISFLVFAIGGDKTMLLQFSGYANYVTGSFIVKIISFLIFAAILNPIYGITGIAYAALISSIISEIFILICIKHFLKFKPYGIF